MKMSSTPRLFKSLSTVAQNLALSFSPPLHTQNVFPAVQINANSDACNFLHNLARAADMVVDGIQKSHGADGLQRSLLPLPDDRQDLGAV